MNISEYKRIMRKPQKRSKYHNRACEYDGHKFDSLFERDYYIKLRMLEKAGEIKDLKLQVPFILQPSFVHNGKTIRAVKYIADFTYLDKTDILHVIDVKGFKTDVYEIKKKMMLYNGYEIEEVRRRRT